MFIGKPKPEQPVRDSRITPYMGFKIATLVNSKGALMFRGPHRLHLPYLPADASKCRFENMRNHTFENHSCGFYAYDDITQAASHWEHHSGRSLDCAILEVALSGEVEVCEEGYRATKQRVTRVIMPPCWLCADKAGVGMLPHSARSFVTGCADCVARVKAQNLLISFEDFAEQHKMEGFAPFKVIAASSATLANIVAPVTGQLFQTAKQSAPRASQ